MTALGADPTFDATALKLSRRRSFLSRIWPFSAKVVSHPTLGRLKPWRNGNYLRARTDFVPANGKIWLVIRAGKAGPTQLQERLFLQIAGHYHALMAGVWNGLLAEYQKVRQVQSAIRWPLVASPGELSSVIGLDAIWLEEGEGRPFVFSFRSELDSDHEFHVFFRDGEMESVAFEG